MACPVVCKSLLELGDHSRSFVVDCGLWNCDRGLRLVEVWSLIVADSFGRGLWLVDFWSWIVAGRVWSSLIVTGNFFFWFVDFGRSSPYSVCYITNRMNDDGKLISFTSFKENI